MIYIVLGVGIIALIVLYHVYILPMIEKLLESKSDDGNWMILRAGYLHRNQKYGDLAYTYHLVKVLDKVKEYSDFFGDDPELMQALEMAAIFHDTLEDVTGYTYNDLKRDAAKVFDDPFYTNMVAEIVYACTNNKGRNRAERAGDEYYKGIRETGYAPFIKACDRLANIEFAKSQGSSLYDKYVQEMPSFIKKIEAADNPVPPKLIEALCLYLLD